MFTHNEVKPGIEITLDAGGDHQFNLGHLRREGAMRLIRMLLMTAGYRRSLKWRVRVEKKFGCGPETRPVTVIGAKPWCCYLKIKPGDNNTAHFCSLIMPDGFRGEAVYEDLKEVENRVSAAWKRGFEGEVAPMEDNAQARPMADPAAAYAEPPPLPELPPELPPEAAEAEEAPDAPEEPEPAGGAHPGEVASAASGGEVSELLGFSADPDKVRLMLLAIYEVCEEKGYRNLDEFVALMAPKMGWQGLKRKQIGGLFTALVRRQLIARHDRGSTPISYELTDEGRKQIEDLIPAGKAPAAKSARSPAPYVPGPVPYSSSPPAPKPAAVMPAMPSLSAVSAQPANVSALFGLVEKLNTGVKRLGELQAKKAQLQGEMDAIEAEIRDLNRHVNNPEVQELIHRLILATGQGG